MVTENQQSEVFENELIIDENAVSTEATVVAPIEEIEEVVLIVDQKATLLNKNNLKKLKKMSDKVKEKEKKAKEKQKEKEKKAKKKKKEKAKKEKTQKKLKEKKAKKKAASKKSKKKSKKK